jgi:formylglycine-generating enzyme required for sulfatase activity
VVQIGPGKSGGLAVRVLASPAGEGVAPFRLPASSGVWIRTRVEVCRRRDLSVDTGAPGFPAPRQVGEVLFRTLFAGQVGLLFARSRGSLASRGEGLRLRLRFHLDPADPRLTVLHGLPWELLCEPDTRDFLALSRRTPVVRSLDSPRPLPPLPIPAGLRILVAMAEVPGLPLDLQQERAHLLEAWAETPGVEILDLQKVGIAALREALLASPIHILHVMGHGVIDPASRSGALILPRSDGSRLAVTGETLAHVLKDIPDLRLVFLNACHTGRIPDGAETDPFSGVATALVLGGVPTVVAMQLPVEDDAAIVFSRTVHGRLAKGDPIEAAVTEGRQAVHALHPDTAEWAIPVLFTRLSDGQIFAPDTAPPTVPAEVPRDVPVPRQSVWRFQLPRVRWLAGGALLLALTALALLARKTSERPIPIERVRLSGFWIARYEVSNREFLLFVERNPQWRRDRIRRSVHDGDYLKHWISPREFPEGLADYPVTRVSWFAAQEYCHWQGGRLPSREEWQMAAHSAESPYPWGKTDPAGPTPLNFCDAACPRQHRDSTELPLFRDGYPETAPVRSFPNGRTREGIYNLSGNVWEWCFTPSGNDRVTMGGSYLMTFQECSTDAQGFEDAKLCAPDVGFRCAWD